MPNRHRSLSRARKELRLFLRKPPGMTDLPEPESRWLRVFTERICRYLLEHLDDDEMVFWEIPFIALHDMVVCAWAWRPADAEGFGDVDAWAEMGAEAHLAFAHLITGLPESVNLMLLVPHMRGFIRFLVEEGAIREADAERLDHEYARFDPTEAPRAVA